MTNSAPELTGEKFTWANYFADKEIVVGETYTITEQELLSGWTDPDGDVLSANFLNTFGGSIGAVGGGDGTKIILSLVDSTPGQKVWQFTIPPAPEFSEIPTEVVFTSRTMFTVNDGAAENGNDGQVKTDAFGAGSFSGEAIYPNGTPSTDGLNQAPELTGEKFTWANYFADKEIVVGETYTITEQDLLSGWTDPDGDTLSANFLDTFGGSIGAVGNNNGPKIIMSLVDSTPGQKVWQFTIPPAPENSTTPNYIVFTSRTMFGVNDGAAENGNDGQVKTDAFGAGSFSGDFITYPSQNVIEAGVEGDDFIFAKYQNNNENNNTAKRGFAADGDYWIKSKNGYDELIGNGQEIAFIAGSRDDVRGINGSSLSAEDVLTGLQEGSIVATRSFASYDGIYNLANFEAGALDELMANGEQVNITRIDAQTGEQIGGTFILDPAQMYDQLSGEFTNSLSTQNGNDFGSIIAADPTLGLI